MSVPSFAAHEIAHRESVLLQCFQACDINQDHFIDAKELETIARAFHAVQQQSPSNTINVDQEVKIIFGKLDMNGDGLIDVSEWCAVLLDLFRFMNDTAFQTHCEELLTLCKKQTTPIQKIKTITENQTQSQTSIITR